jgi:6-phosphogluconolactonase (cycloisomerase 2 family)
MVASPDGKSLYVVNEDDSTVEQFLIGTDGKLYPHSTFQSKGGSALPVAIAYDTAFNNLYIAYTYQPGYSSLNAGPGALVIDSLNSDGSFGKQVINTNGNDYWPVGYSPIAIAAATSGSAAGAPTNVYVTAYNSAQNTSGELTGFQTTASTVSSTGNITVGTQLSSVAVTAPMVPTGKSSSVQYVYLTDKAQNLIYAYAVSGVNQLARITTSVPLTTGNGPSAITVAGGGSDFYLLVSNYIDGTVSSFPINPATGVTPVGMTAITSTALAATGPVAIAVEPELGRFAYTVNFLDNSVAGFMLNASNGSLLSTQGTPYGTNGQPTAIAIVRH